MAEAIALGASVVAFIQLTDRVIQVSKYYIEALHDCPRDIRTILVEVSSLKAILENLDFIHNSAADSPLLRQVCSEDGPVVQCRKSVAELERMLPPEKRAVGNKRQKIAAAAQLLAWPLKENAARRHLKDIAGYKSTIAIALTSDTVRDIKDITTSMRIMRQQLDSMELDRVCSWLEAINPSPIHNGASRLREQDTCAWMLRTPEWKNWLDGDIRFVWVHGIPGTGKTILASHLINCVHDMCKEQDFLAKQSRKIFGKADKAAKVICIYYYCHYAHNQDEAGPLLRWMIGQLCRVVNTVPQELIQLYQSKHAPNVKQLLDSLEAMLDDFDIVFLLIDAVDESLPREDLLKVLRLLVTDGRFDKIRLLATSREYYDIETCFSGLSLPISMNDKIVGDDISRYIRSSLASNPKFRNWPEELLAETKEALSKGAKGMFRWAVCQIDVLQRLKSHEEARQAIVSLPKTLDETYERIFQLIPAEDREFVRLALNFICSNDAIRPTPMAVNALLLLILRRIHPWQDMELGPHFYNADTLQEICGCLISFRPSNELKFVTLAHYTIAEFLYSERISQGPMASFAISRATLCEICIQDAWEVVIQLHRQGSLAETEANLDPLGLPYFCILAINIISFKEKSISKFGQDKLQKLYSTMDVIKILIAFCRLASKIIFTERHSIQENKLYTSSEAELIRNLKE